MGLRGPKPKEKVSTRWTADLSYIIGLIVTDGCLYGDRRHINFVSTDLQLIRLFKKLLKLENKIGLKKSKDTISQRKISYVIQFGDVIFFDFLCSIGLMPNKTKIMSKILIPDEYYRDFLRGHFDGDGTSYSYLDKRWRNSFMFYVSFVSASKKHIYWIQEKNKQFFGVEGHMTKVKDKEFYQLRYAKREGLVIIHKMYYTSKVPCLIRKRKKLFDTININAQVLKLVDRHA